MGFPACHFDDSHIKMMLRKGFDFEDARDYCLMGCVEPQKSGRIYQWTSTGYTQWPIAIEFVLNRGRMVLFDSYQGLDTGDLRDLHTFEDFDAAVKNRSPISYACRRSGRSSASACTATWRLSR